MRSTIACALLLCAVAACDKGDKKDEQKEGAAAGEASGSAQASGSAAADTAAAGSGTGTAVAVVTVDAAPAPPPVPAGMTGSASCDELIARTYCMYSAMGDNMPKDTIDAFQKGIEGWKAGLGDPATKAATEDACKQSLGYAMTGFKQLGCDGAVADLKGQDFARGAGTGAGAGVGAGGGGSAGALPAGYQTSGAAECDELIIRTLCSYKKAGPQLPASAIEAFESSIQAWRDNLANDATKQYVVDACKNSLDAGRDGFAAVGCGGDLAGLDISGVGGGAAPTKTASGPVGEIKPLGEPTCDKLIERTTCMYKKLGGDAMNDAMKAFSDGVEAWRGMLGDKQLRQTIVDACKQSLDAADQGYKQMGC